ncbi:MAG TPA: hypothetical protein VKA46_19000 [Gemmataceae bacterium]|nr:hypothetical protein [Gemmataceae bacterium]
MTIAESNQVYEVVRRVQSWPASLRIALARRILQTLENGCPAEPAPALPRGPSAAEVAAMFKTDKPDDEECQRILEEELMKKYGQ